MFAYWFENFTYANFAQKVTFFVTFAMKSLHIAIFSYIPYFFSIVWQFCHTQFSCQCPMFFLFNTLHRGMNFAPYQTMLHETNQCQGYVTSNMRQNCRGFQNSCKCLKSFMIFGFSQHGSKKPMTNMSWAKCLISLRFSKHHDMHVRQARFVPNLKVNDFRYLRFGSTIALVVCMERTNNQQEAQGNE